MNTEINIGDIVVLNSFRNIDKSSIYTYNRLVVKQKLRDDTIICLYPDKDTNSIKETTAIPLQCVFKFDGINK